MPELAHHMALAPLVWLLALRTVQSRRDPAYWWLAGAFAVSWIADALAHVVDPQLVGAVYPVSQAALVCAVLGTRDDAKVFVVTLVGAGLASLVLDSRPDLLLRTVAWVGVAGLVWDRPGLGRLRGALLVTFGLGWLAWLVYVAFPGWDSWGAYQLTRAAGIGWFCWAVVTPRPVLRVA